jgi:hypothetical protein
MVLEGPRGEAPQGQAAVKFFSDEQVCIDTVAAGHIQRHVEPDTYELLQISPLALSVMRFQHLPAKQWSIFRMQRDRQRRWPGGHHRGAMDQNLTKQSLAF